MKRFLLCSFALVLLYPAGIDMYLVGLPRIAADLNASEAQLHIAFSDGLTALFTGVGRLAISEWAFSSGSRRRRLLCGGVRHSARHARRASPGESAVIIEWDYLYCAGTRPGGGAFDYASFPLAKSVLYDVRDGHYCGPVITVYPARDAPGKAGSTRFITIVARRRVADHRRRQYGRLFFHPFCAWVI